MLCCQEVAAANCQGGQEGLLLCSPSVCFTHGMPLAEEGQFQDDHTTDFRKGTCGGGGGHLTLAFL